MATTSSHDVARGPAGEAAAATWWWSYSWPTSGQSLEEFFDSAASAPAAIAAVAAESPPLLAAAAAKSSAKNAEKRRLKRRLLKASSASAVAAATAAAAAAAAACAPADVAHQLWVCMQCSAWVDCRAAHSSATGHGTYSLVDAGGRPANYNNYKCLQCHRRIANQRQVSDHMRKYRHVNFVKRAAVSAPVGGGGCPARKPPPPPPPILDDCDRLLDPFAALTENDDDYFWLGRPVSLGCDWR